MVSKSEHNLLSDREEQVLLLSTKGLTDKEIARKLNLSIATVNTYWVRIRTKLGGANRAELVAAALSKNAEETLTAKELENQKLISEVVRRADTERALIDSQNRLQSIIDGTPLVVFLKDLQGRYSLVNREFELLTGKERREILGKRDLDLFPREDAERYRGFDQQVLDSGEPVEFEIVWPSPDGPRHYLSVEFPLLTSDDSIYAVCGFSREITARKEFEDKLALSEERFRLLIENCSDVVTLIDPNGKILYTSPGIAKVLDIAPEAMVGRNVLEFIYRDDLTAIRRDMEMLQKRPGNSLFAEHRVKRTDGTIRYLEGQGKNLLGEAAVDAIVLNYRDVTDRKLAERRIGAQFAVAKALAGAKNVEAAAIELARLLCETLSFDYGAVWLTDEDKTSLGLVGGWHSRMASVENLLKVSRSMRFKRGEGFPGRVWKSQGPEWLTNISVKGFARESQVRAGSLKSAIGFPIMAGEEFLGVFECFSRKVVSADEELVKVLEAIGHQVGQFIKRSEAEAEELRLARQLSATTTELNRSVESVVEERRQYRDLFDDAPDGYVVTDLKGTITEANRAALALFGTPMSGCVGKKLSEFVVDDLKKEFESRLASLPKLNSLHEWELRIRPLDRAAFDASLSVSIVRDGSGKATSQRWLLRDVTARKFVEHELKAANEALERRVRTRTIELEEANLRLQEEIAERKRAEADLLSSHRFVQNVVESSVDGIFAFDRFCRYMIWNKSMERISGLPKEEVLGQYAFDLFPFLTEIGEDDCFHRALRGETVASRNRPYIVVSTGKSGYFDAHYSPLKSDEGEIIGGLAVIRETTESVGSHESAKLR